MSSPSVHKKFIFNEKIDGDYLFSLYEHDYPYIAEVFGNSLDSLKEESGHFVSAYESANVRELKNAAHKIKPIFGFTGLLAHQEQIARFEHLCENTSTVSNITLQYMELIEMMKEGKNIIKEDYNRLTEFIA